MDAAARGLGLLGRKRGFSPGVDLRDSARKGILGCNLGNSFSEIRMEVIFMSSSIKCLRYVQERPFGHGFFPAESKSLQLILMSLELGRLLQRCSIRGPLPPKSPSGQMLTRPSDTCIYDTRSVTYPSCEERKGV